MAPSINLRTYPPSPKPPPLRPSPRSIKRITTLTLIASILLILYFLAPPTPLPTLQTTLLPTTHTQSSIRIAKATIAYPPSNNISARSLALHASQGHETHVLRTPIVKGFANTFLWLQHVMTRELLKSENERAEWILFFAPSVIVANTAVPLQIFLPPLATPEFGHVHVIGSKRDGRGMDSGLFFVRVGPLAVRVLVLAVASVHLEPRRDWGGDVVGAALQGVLEREEYRDKVVWQPGAWFDGAGAAFVQVNGLSGVEKLGEMDTLIRRRDAVNKMVPSKREVGEFWDTFKIATLVLREAGYRGHTSVEGEFAVWVRGLKKWVELRTWDVEGIRERMDELKAKLGIGDIIGYEMNIG